MPAIFFSKVEIELTIIYCKLSSNFSFTIEKLGHCWKPIVVQTHSLFTQQQTESGLISKVMEVREVEALRLTGNVRTSHRTYCFYIVFAISLLHSFLI